MLQDDDRVAFNNAYYSILKIIRNISEELQILLAPDRNHKNIFADIPGIYFKDVKSLKNIFVGLVLPKIEVAVKFFLCGGKRLCEMMSKLQFLRKKSQMKFIILANHSVQIRKRLFI